MLRFVGDQAAELLAADSSLVTDDDRSTFSSMGGGLRLQDRSNRTLVYGNPKIRLDDHTIIFRIKISKILNQTHFFFASPAPVGFLEICRDAI